MASWWCTNVRQGVRILAISGVSILSAMTGEAPPTISVAHVQLLLNQGATITAASEPLAVSLRMQQQPVTCWLTRTAQGELLVRPQPTAATAKLNLAQLSIRPRTDLGSLVLPRALTIVGRDHTIVTYQFSFNRDGSVAELREDSRQTPDEPAPVFTHPSGKLKHGDHLPPTPSPQE